ncbi:hypothetical protein HH310_25595 [Actinoplanes sp. TBRC 11911]|uniref:hypothetical protein n=1 Tax=Actinoplanes sp. TBRC 11911 TaxID=2729386 RepID=UPI00145F6316|nr:hypothetical protein [Actinoplanes sp. TBRC 11911]NMO54544.1 hypothetical protein [Actinoplanes sp. TBRC 11911]
MTRLSWREPVWFARPAHRLPFIAALTAAAVGPRCVRAPRPYRGGFALRCTITPPGIGACTVTIVFGKGSPEVPRVFVDGPTDSPHRYVDGSLCMWYPYDPPERRWQRSDGPVVLLGHIAAHLIREHWWRRTGEWAGDEAAHRTQTPQQETR